MVLVSPARMVAVRLSSNIISLERSENGREYQMRHGSFLLRSVAVVVLRVALKVVVSLGKVSP